jgi:ribosomal protein S18 acetylase RimI-like enzyme
MENRHSREALDLGQEPSIRPFTADDTADVISLWKAVFNYPTAHNDPATVIRLKQKVQPELFLVWVEQKRAVATVMGGYDGHRGWIYSVAVHLEYRRRGIATQLVKHLEQLLKQRGCLKINLQLLTTNAATTAFYQSLGYQIEERISMGKVV